MAVPKGTRIGGRAKGTPNKATADVKALAQLYTDEAMDALVDLLRSADSDATKLGAAREILDRGHGKPKQSMDLDANLRAVVNVVELCGPDDAG